MTNRTYGQATEAAATTVLLVVAGHLHDLPALEDQLHHAAEMIATGDKSGEALRQLQVALRKLHLTVKGIREPFRDFHVTGGTGTVPTVAKGLEALVDRLQERGVAVKAAVDARDGDRWVLSRVDVRAIADYLCLDEPRVMSVAVTATDPKLTFTADIGPGLHSFRWRNRDRRLRPPLPMREEPRRDGGAHIEIDFPLRRL